MTHLFYQWGTFPELSPSFYVGLPGRNSQTAIELLLSQPALMENLRKAHMGNYSIILSLLGCLDHGIKAKKLVDKVIDSCESI